MGELEKRPTISQKVVDIFTKLVDSQDDKGWKKYGKTMDDAGIDPETGEPYDWNRMALEEAVDGLKYLLKDNQLQQDLRRRIAIIAEKAAAENARLDFELTKLSDFILEYYPHEIGLGNPKEGESAVDVAIRLLKDGLMRTRK